MSRKSRIAWANSFIGVLAVAGGVVLTHHYAPTAFASSGSTGATGSTGSTGSTGATGSTSSGSTGGTPAGVTGTVSSDDIPYQFGDIKLSVTKTNGKITAIDIGSSTASAGRDQAFPYLVQYAIKAQGSSFGNLSGATYTTAAFKQALDNALAKLG